MNAQRFEQIELFGGRLADASEMLITELDTVLLQTQLEFHRGLGTLRGAVGLQPDAHDPIEHQAKETN